MITRRDLVVALGAICTTIAAVSLGQSSDKPLMKSSTFDWDSLKVQETKTGQKRQVFDAPTATVDRLECHITTVNPGERSHAPHQHLEEELMIVKEGTLESMQNGETKVVGPGAIIFEGSNEMHGVRNIGQTPATYYVLKWYTPNRPKN